MSAKEQMRKMLDELMGTARNGDEKIIDFFDPRVCKCFLLECCPNEILVGTRMDLGECPQIHDPALRADYKLASATREYFFEYDAVQVLERFFRECDRRTEDCKRHLDAMQSEPPKLEGENAENKANANGAEHSNTAEVKKLDDEIAANLIKVEQLGGAGKVAESLELHGKVEALTQQKQQLLSSVQKSSEQSAAVAAVASSSSSSSVGGQPPSPPQPYQQKLRVCEVCSVYLGVHDNDRRLADHFSGKLHVGFLSLRQSLDKFRTKLNIKRPPPLDSNSNSSVVFPSPNPYGVVSSNHLSAITPSASTVRPDVRYTYCTYRREDRSRSRSSSRSSRHRRSRHYSRSKCSSRCRSPSC